jgi:WD40 repeat protein
VAGLFGQRGRRRFDLRHPEAPAAVLGSFAAGVRALALGANGDRLAAGSAAGELRVWDLRQPGLRPRELDSRPAGREEGTRPEATVSSVAFQPGGRILAAGGSDAAVLWDLDRAAPAVRLDTDGKRVLVLAWSPDGAVVAAGLGQGGGARLWNARQTAEASSACPGKEVRALAFQPGGSVLACGTGQGEILLWDAAQRRSSAANGRLQGPAAAVNALRFSPDGKVLAGAFGDGSARLWIVGRAEEPIVLPGHDSWVWAVAFSPDGTKLLSGGEDRTIHLWSPRSALLAARICRQVHRDLKPDEWQKWGPRELSAEMSASCPPGA